MGKDLELFEKYQKIRKKIIGLSNSQTFEFTIDVFENCLFTFFEILKLKSIKELTALFIDYNRLEFNRLLLKLKLEFDYKIIDLLFEATTVLSHLIDEMNKSLLLCQNSSGLGFEPLSDLETNKIAKENFTKRRQQTEARFKGGKFDHYYYQFIGLSFNSMQNLFFIDNVRSTLKDKGDTLYPCRDAVYSIVKYFNYMGGMKLEQN